VQLDESGFNQRLEAQRERGKASWKDVAGPALATEAPAPQKTSFLGYTDLKANDARILAIHKDGKPATDLQAEENGLVFLDKTPFYAETGGQVGDTGILEEEFSEAIVHNTYPFLPGYFAHDVKCIRGDIKVGDLVQARVDVARRMAIAKNHTATHLLHASLRNLIGFHVKQAGSLVAPDRLRFDFTHYVGLSPAEISEIEDMVNSVISQNFPVSTQIRDLNAAISEGAMALFGEKYGEQVRVVSVDTFSKELCGGTHVRRSGDIGLFKVVSENGIAAGVRRIEAITGLGSLDRFREDEQLILRLEELTKGKRSELPDIMDRYQSNLKTLEKELEGLKYQIAKDRTRSILNSAVSIKGIKVVTGVVDDLDKSALRNLADELRAQVQQGVVVLATTSGDKVAIVATVTPALTPKVHAGKLVKAISAIVGGNGGGRPDMAEAGGKDPSKLNQALQSVGPFLASILQ